MRIAWKFILSRNEYSPKEAALVGATGGVSVNVPGRRKCRKVRNVASQGSDSCCGTGPVIRKHTSRKRK